MNKQNKWFLTRIRCSLCWTACEAFTNVIHSVCSNLCQRSYNTKLLNVGVLRYTGIDDNRDIQSNNYRYRVNLVSDDIPVLAITAIFKMNRSLMLTLHVNTPAPDLQLAVLRLTRLTRRRAALAATREEPCSSEKVPIILLVIEWEMLH